MEQYESDFKLLNDISFVIARLPISKLLSQAQNWSGIGAHPDAVQFRWLAEGFLF